MRLSLRDAPVLVSAVACVAAGCEREVQPVVVAPEEVPTAAPEAEPVVRRVTATTTCPDALEAPDLTDRIIKASCGVVRVKKGYRVDAGTLTLEAGVTLAFEPEAELTVGYRQPAKLIVAGTREQPVLFTSTETKAAGAWKGLYLYEHADGSRIQGLHIEYAAQGIRGPIYVLADDVTIDDSEIRDSLDVAVHVSQQGRLTSFSGNKVMRMSADVVMFLPPASVSAVAQDNQFPEGSVIHVLPGILRERVRWSDPGVPYVIGGVLEIAGEDDETEALLELSPGTILKFDEDAYMNVGYYRPGALRAEGMPDQPIVFTSAVEQVAGAWRGVSLYKNASASFSHVTFEYGSRRVDRGVLFANSQATLSLQDCVFRDNGGGVVLQGADLRVTALERNRWERSTPALDVSAQAYGYVGEGNVFAEHTQIIVEGGSVEHTARWRDLGVPLDVTSEVRIDNGAKLTIDPGVAMRVRDGFTLSVGELDGGSLRMEGLAERPISLVGVNDRRGTWDAIRLHAKSTGNVLQHVKLRNAGGVAAVEVMAGSDAAIEHLACARCYSPAVLWSCGSQVTADSIEISDGTPDATIPPTGCGS
jgi:hypothetical protein